jgi:hypothetical protein
VGNTAGFTVDRNGTTSNLYKRYPRQVNCRVDFTITNTTVTTVMELPETVVADGATASAVAMSTTTVSSTTVVTAEVPRRTVYAACGANNIGEWTRWKGGRKGCELRIAYSELGRRLNRRTARLLPSRVPAHRRVSRCERIDHEHDVCGGMLY